MGGHHLIDGSSPAPPWRRLLVPAAARSVLVLLATLGAWAVVVPLVGGFRPIVVSSGSMHPALDVGDVVLVDRDAEPARGGVATFVHPQVPGALVTHRLVGHDDDGWRTRGDANATEDPWRVSNEEVVGLTRLVVPSIGLPTIWARQGRNDLLAASAAGLVLLLSLAGAFRSTGGRHLRLTLAHRMKRLGQLLLRGAAGVAAVALVAAQQPAEAVFSSATSAPTGSFSAATVPAPTNLTASARCLLLVVGAQIDVSWDPVAGATGYEVYRSTGAGFTLRTTIAGTGWTDSAVLTGTTYTYRVRALVGTWSSPDSGLASGTTGLCLL